VVYLHLFPMGDYLRHHYLLNYRRHFGRCHLHPKACYPTVKEGSNSA
jgi:hypothetical protein